MLEKMQNILMLHAFVGSKHVNIKIHYKMFRNKAEE
jgi:hypothetical protein